MNKKKIVAVALCVCMAATAVVGGTLAYFTDVAEAKKNTFTIGNIDISLTETAKVTDKDGKELTGNLVENEKKDGYTYKDLMPTYKLEKKPVVKNESTTNDAYVRVAVVMNNVAAINNAIDEVYEDAAKINPTTGKVYTAAEIQAIYDNVFDGWGVNYSKRTEYPSGTRMWMDDRTSDTHVLCNIDTIARINEKYYRIDSKNAFMTEAEKVDENGDGIFDVNWDDLSVSYYVNAAKNDERVYVFYLKLGAGESYTLFNGLNVPADFNAGQMNMFKDLKISVYADAIQTAGFDTFTAAFNALEAEHPLGWWNN